jgi:hypothetical protein
MTAEELALGIVGLISGVLGMPIIGWFTKRWNLDDTSALSLAVAISVIISVVALFAAGQIGYLDFSWANLPALITMVYGLATVVYNAIRGKKTA